jgi:hypothetical protein
MMTAAPSLAKLDVRIPLKGAPPKDWTSLIPVFHGWIQRAALDGVLVDVAEYTHVAEGPQVVLIAHEGHWALDTTAGRPALLYSQRRPPAASPELNVKRAIREAIRACALLAADAKLAFDLGTLEIAVNDRNEAPNEPASYEAVEPVFRATLSCLYGDGCSLSRETDPRKRCGVTVSAKAAPDLETALQRLQ